MLKMNFKMNNIISKILLVSFILIFIASSVNSVEYVGTIGMDCSNNLCAVLKDRCGDHVCGITESCSSCSSDCGSCPAAPVSGGSSGGGGGGGGYGGAGASGAMPSIEEKDESVINIVLQSVPSDFVNPKVFLILAPKTESFISSESDISKLVSASTSDEVSSYLSKILNQVSSGDVKAESISKTMAGYMIKSDDGRTAYVTTVKLVLRAGSDISNLRIIDYVPKSIVNSSDEFDFIDTDVVIIQNDPILRFSSDKLNSGDTAVMQYNIPKRVNQNYGVVIAYSEKEVVCVDDGICSLNEPSNCNDCNKKSSYCGNNFCESGENMNNCCLDCGCNDNEMCSENKCVSTVQEKKSINIPEYNSIIFTWQVLIVGLLLAFSMGYLALQGKMDHHVLRGKLYFARYRKWISTKIKGKGYDEQLGILDKQLEKINKK